ncbi:MAG: FtsX-like permease family protein, partial [Verrucomicrobiota bacterium]
LAAIRSSLLEGIGGRFDPLKILVFFGLFAGLTAFAIQQSPSIRIGLGFSAGIAVVFLLLFLFAKAIAWIVRKGLRSSWPYPLRQGLSNLYRPNNLTTLFMLSLGLGVFLILTLSLTQKMLLGEISQETMRQKGNLFLIDVQPDQREAVSRTLGELDAEIIDQAPMISMRIQSINGTSVSDLVKDKDRDIPGWVLRREFRCTYREELGSSETLVEGEWIPSVEDFDFESGVAPVSLEKDIAADLKVGLGDTLIMDVQGIPLKLKIASLREVNWESMGLNFFILFPTGILEEAPAFLVYTANARDASHSGEIQTGVTKAFPNVTVVDVSLVLNLLLSILDKVAFAIRFMALFTILTGLLILVATLFAGRNERLKEAVLLRTLGASQKQIYQIFCFEYLFLGCLAGLTGGLLALIASSLLATFVFKTSIAFTLLPILLAVIMVGLGTLVIGILLSRGTTKPPPLAILRETS